MKDVRCGIAQLTRSMVVRAERICISLTGCALSNRALGSTEMEPPAFHYPDSTQWLQSKMRRIPHQHHVMRFEIGIVDVDPTCGRPAQCVATGFEVELLAAVRARENDETIGRARHDQPICWLEFSVRHWSRQGSHRQAHCCSHRSIAVRSAERPIWPGAGMNTAHTPLTDCPSTQEPFPETSRLRSPQQRSQPSSPRASRSGSTSSIVSRLSDEWARIARRPRAISQANQWNLPGGPVDHLDVVLERCGFDQPGNQNQHDEYLSDLVRIAAHDQLAARIVLQRIIPGLISIAVRRAPITANGLAGAFDLVTSAAWLVICQFPIDRRPRRVAANLLMDIEYLAFVRDSRLKSSRNEQPLHPDGMLGIESGRLHAHDTVSDPVSDASAFDLMMHSFSMTGVSERDLQMLRAVAYDINSTEAAAILGLSPRSVRNRRENALVRALALLSRDDHGSQREEWCEPGNQRSGKSS